MPAARFRIRTLMIAVAAVGLAVWHVEFLGVPLSVLALAAWPLARIARRWRRRAEARTDGGALAGLAGGAVAGAGGSVLREATDVNDAWRIIVSVALIGAAVGTVVQPCVAFWRVWARGMANVRPRPDPRLP